jgi:hypothetical protein
MKFSVVALAALTSSVLAAPQGNPLTSGLESMIGQSIEKNLEKQTGKKRPTGPDTFQLKRCVPAVLIVARGTSETGNVVSCVSSAMSYCQRVTQPFRELLSVAQYALL